MSEFGDIYRGRRVLITGHTGFKGSWLSLWLNQLGAEVAGYALEDQKDFPNLEMFDLGSCIKDFRGDICDLERLSKVFEEFKPEFVFHLAAQALVLSSHDRPVATFETNVMGMVNVLECVRNNPSVDVAVLITSDKVYQNEEWCWGYRENDTLGGHDPYSGSKSCAEHVVHSYVKSFLAATSTVVATARAGNVIGGGDWAMNRIVPDCVRAWSEERSVKVRSPLATRPWQHVLEPLSGYLWLGSCLFEKRSKLDGEAFNFGPAQEHDRSVGELLEAMVERWPGAEWESVSPSGPPEEAMRLKLSCDKALSVLGWHAVLDFEESVSLTADWYRYWNTNKKGMANYSISQIAEYVRKSSDRKLAWASK